MKLIFKYLFAFIIMILIVPVLNIEAKTYTDQFNDIYEWIPNTYVSKTKNGYTKYQQMTLMVRKSDNQFVYCIENGVTINSSFNYTGYDYDQAFLANITQEQWKRIQLLSYYGYGYSDNEVNHNDIKWYSITQFMIWNTIPNGFDIYFTDSLNGNRIEKYTSEINEMEKLISNHYTIPDFGSTNYELLNGETLKITDSNSVLSKFSIESDNNTDVIKNGNDLYITGKNIGSSTIKFKKEDSKYSHASIVYIGTNTQNILATGSYDPINISLNINIVGGKIRLIKHDSLNNSCNPQGEASLVGAKYGIYNSQNVLINTLIVDNNCTATSDLLPYGTYKIKELVSSNGYQLDKNVYSVDIVDKNTINLVVKEKVIENNFEFYKFYGNEDTGFIFSESNATFKVLNNNQDVVLEFKTDDKGYAKITLPYGNYQVIQTKGLNDYKLMHPFNISVNENTPLNQVNYIKNGKITAKLKIVKVDSETKKQITIKGAKFKIKDKNTNQYVCQTTDRLICEFETNDKGIMITPLPLFGGDYVVEEIKAPNGYLISNEKIEFSIKDGMTIIEDNVYGSLIEIVFEDKPVKGKIIIHKTGEKINFENNSFNYEKINLSDVKFEIRATEDIIINNYKYYSKDELVKVLITDIGGNTFIDNLPLGKYYIKEISSANNNIINDEVYNVELKYENETTEIISVNIDVKNYLPKGKLEFTKTDLTTGNVIPNTKISIYDENDVLIYTGITDENGKIVIDNLYTGKFYIIEEEPATGYKLSDEKVFFEIKGNGEIVKSNMSNEIIITDVPATGKNDFPIANLLGTIFLILGIGVVFYEKKKNN